MRILLIDDNKKLCILYQQLLMRGGHDTQFETDPTKALIIIRENQPDLILLDIMMEPISGWDVLEQIRNDQECSDIPIVILTGKVLTAVEAVKYGLMIEGFIMKPLERTMLLDAISEVKDVLDESEERYLRALSSGMTADQAYECKIAIKKKKILQILRETLTKQEQIMKKDSDINSEITHNLDELRALISHEYHNLIQLTENCP